MSKFDIEVCKQCNKRDLYNRCEDVAGHPECSEAYKECGNYEYCKEKLKNGKKFAKSLK